MHRFIDGEDRMQQTLLPNSLEDYVSEENPVRVNWNGAIFRRSKVEDDGCRFWHVLWRGC